MIGVAYSLLASQTHDPEVRPKYHETAIKHLTSSIDIDSSGWETYYQLALQQAETRDIAHAIASVSQALRINSTHTPSWHLLTLLSSCPVAGNLNQAMQSFELGSIEVEREDEQNRDGDAANSIYPSGLQSHDNGEEMLAFQTTGAVLRDALGDTDLALESHEGLFALYGKVSTIDPTIAAFADYGGTFSRKSSVIGSNATVSDIPRGRRRSASASNTTLVIPRQSNSVTVSKSQDDVNNVRGGPSYSASSFGGSDSPRTGTSSSLVVPTTLSEGEGEKQLPNGAVQRSKSSHRRTLHMFSRKHKKSEIPDLPTKEANSSNDSSGKFYGKVDNSSTVGDYRSLRSPTPSIGTKTSIRSIYQPVEPGVHVTTRTRIRYKRCSETLSNLWLLSALAFLKLGKLEEARKAIEEAEGNDPSGNPRVWIVLGRLRLAQNRIDDAISAFQKALVVNPYDADGRLWLARTYIETGETEAAEGLLDRLTKGNGWDSAEAWYYLGDIYQKMDRLQRAKECLWYALELENTKPILPFSVLPRCI
jgi:tetratricopeptide (TPR) repeat protein